MYGGEGGDHIPSLLERLSEYECSGCYEDALCKTHTPCCCGQALAVRGAVLLPSCLLLRFPAAAQQQSRVAGQHDMVGYEELRRRANRPIGLHHMPLGATTEITQHRMGDFYSKCSRPFASSCKPLVEFAAQCLATTTSARP